MATLQTRTPSQSFRPATHRPIPLRRRPGLVENRIDSAAGESWVIHDPVALTYHRLEPEQKVLLSLLNGERSLEDLKRAMATAFPGWHWSGHLVHELINQLHQQGLTISARPGQGSVQIEREGRSRTRRWMAAAVNWLGIRFPGWNPDRLLQMLVPLFGWFFHPAMWALCGLLAAGAGFFVLMHLREFIDRLPEFQAFFGWPNVLYLWLTLAVTKICHEFGHGIACRRYGAACREMGVMLLVFTPTLYCDVTDAWRLPSKWQRIAIAGAGMFVEVFLSVIALTVFWWTVPGPLHYLALNCFLVTTVTTVMFNANPLLKYDGYYMLSDLLEVPNLRQKATSVLQEFCSRYLLGLETPPAPFVPRRKRFWFLLYSILAPLYSWFIYGSILVFFYVWLKPAGLQSIGIMLAVVSLAGMLINLLRQGIAMIKAPRQGEWKWGRALLSGTVLAGLIAGVLSIPVPWYVEAAAMVEPRDIRHVHTTAPGRLVQRLCEPGLLVTAGQPLVILTNDLLDQRIEENTAERDRRLKEADAALAMGREDERTIALEQAAGAAKRLAELITQRESLTIRAPIAGRLIAPVSRQPSAVDRQRRQLGSWTGSPLDSQNLASEIPANTHIVSIAPSDQWQAVMYLRQQDRNDMALGQTVLLKWNHLPQQTLRSTIQQLASEQTQIAPTELTSLAGGPLPVTHRPNGDDVLQDLAYRAIAPLDGNATTYVTGLRGAARCVVSERTVGQWACRWFWQTLHFRL